jgi:hypothetical protein
MNLLTLHDPLPYPLPYPPPPPVTIPEALTIKPVPSRWIPPYCLLPGRRRPNIPTPPTRSIQITAKKEIGGTETREDAGKDISHHTTLQHSALISFRLTKKKKEAKHTHLALAACVENKNPEPEFSPWRWRRRWRKRKKKKSRPA